MSEATAEPAVDETQETEEPEEEPIVDNSADYSVAFEDDGSGSSAWYLHGIILWEPDIRSVTC